MTDYVTEEEVLAARLTDLRRHAGWSLDQLAEKSGVSRATLSRIERGNVSPTAAVLCQIAKAHSVPVSVLFSDTDSGGEALVPHGKQTVWEDASCGFRRRSVSPAIRGFRGSLIEGELRPGCSISYDTPPLPGLEHHLVLLSGGLEVTVSGVVYHLAKGDCLRFRLDGPNQYRATGSLPARYLLTVITP